MSLPEARQLDPSIPFLPGSRPREYTRARMPSTPPVPSRTLTFAIHDLNTWAGQERCTLEVARRLSHRWPVEIYAFTLDDPLLETGWGKLAFHRIPGPVSRLPFLFAATYYYLATLPLLWRRRSPGSIPPTLIHAAGACSLISDVVQVHFVQAAWNGVRAGLPEDLIRPPRATTASGPRSVLMKAYYELLMMYHVAVEKRVFAAGKTYIAVSRGVANELQRWLGITRNVHVIHHGIDAERFRPPAGAGDAERASIRGRLGIEPGEIAVLFVGAFDRKGLATIVDAVALLEPRLRDRVKIVAAGSGNRERYVARARDRGIEGRLVFTGYQKDIAPYYRMADIFLFPTLYEPFGMAILEAMASGLPVIVSRCAGASEMLSHGESGLLIDDPRSAREIAAALGGLVADEGTRRSLGQRARLVAEKRDWDTVAREYAALLEPLMDPR